MLPVPSRHILSTSAHESVAHSVIVVCCHHVLICIVPVGWLLLHSGLVIGSVAPVCYERIELLVLRSVVMLHIIVVSFVVLHALFPRSHHVDVVSGGRLLVVDFGILRVVSVDLRFLV